MAAQEFILQGFSPKTHREAVSRLFDVPNITRVIISVAFVSRGGTELLESKIKKYGSKAQAFIGIRNDITSIQGARHLFDMGVSLHVVDTGARSLLFHPKLYLVRGTAHARLVIGSANLTIGGLNNNIEAGVVIGLDLNNPEERRLVESIENDFDALTKGYPEHVIAISKVADLVAMQESGRLIDESATSPPRPASVATNPSDDVLPRIKLKVTPLRRALSKAKKAGPKPGTVSVPGAPKKKAAPVKKAASTSVAPAVATGVAYELVWESKALTRRDLDVPDGKTTHRTGSINLDKGLLADEIDHRHYFRDEVFPGLNWSAGSRPNIEEAYAKFQLVLKGISYGEFDLRIGHSTNTKSTSYRQRNAMTRLSWGPMREYVARPDLIDRTLSLYRDKADPKRFVLEID